MCWTHMIIDHSQRGNAEQSIPCIISVGRQKQPPKVEGQESLWTGHKRTQWLRKGQTNAACIQEAFAATINLGCRQDLKRWHSIYQKGLCQRCNIQCCPAALSEGLLQKILPTASHHSVQLCPPLWRIDSMANNAQMVYKAWLIPAFAPLWLSFAHLQVFFCK